LVGKYSSMTAYFQLNAMFNDNICVKSIKTVKNMAILNFYVALKLQLNN
jgi:hypothetical protein